MPRPSTSPLPSNKAWPEAASLGKKLLSWYRAHKRDLPWRRTKDPYAILVSEAMLQQTRVEVVIPYFERWMERFPDVATLAAAPEDEVLAAFSGLGYYRRARNLKKAAAHIIENHDGVVPRTLKELRALPGVGEYTAGAVASIAFDLPEPAVDGNVRRVLSRIRRIEVDPASRAGASVVRESAHTLLESGHPRDLNQALMELGARVCTPTGSRCGGCPVAAECAAFDVGDVDRFPVKTITSRKRVRMIAQVATIQMNGSVLLVHRQVGQCDGVLEGMWEAPFHLIDPQDNPSDRLLGMVKEWTGQELEMGEMIGSAKHSITYRDVEIRVFSATLKGKPARKLEGKSWVWTPVSSLGTGSPTSSLTKKAVRVATRLKGAGRGSSRRLGTRG